MTLSNVLPVLFVFLVWGIKPGPHTITLIFKTLQSGTRSALLIAIGNNITHLLFFWSSILAFTFLSPSDWVVFFIRIAAGLYIIVYSLYSAFNGSDPSFGGVAGKRTASILTGFFVGLSNPLNLSFYLGVMPQIFTHSYSYGDIIVMSFLVFCSLLAGQSLYIGFADGVRMLIKSETFVRRLWIYSNVAFAFVGVYFIVLAFTS